MRLFYTNLIDAASVVITETSEVSTLPSSNVAHELRGKVWRTGTSVALEAVVFDLGSAMAVTSCIVLDHTLTAGDSLIRIQGHTADSWGAPSFSQTFTYAADILSAIFASQSYRYWRFTFTKSAAGESRDVGRIFLGTFYSTEEDPDYDGLDIAEEDLSRKQMSLGGQEYTEQLDRWRTVKCQFTHISQTMKDNVTTYVRSVGQATSHFVQAATTSPFDTIYYVKLKNTPKFQVKAMDSSAVWDTTLEFKEQL